MKISKNEIRKEIERKQAILSHAEEQLKQEFFGIDSAIRRLMEAFGPWYIFPEAQETPCIINLWGMTGVGKTSLIRRLVQLTGLDEIFYSLDAEDYGGAGGGFYSTLKDIHSLHNGSPVVLALDEFQHLRTKDHQGYDILKMRSQTVWELLDTGHLVYFDLEYRCRSLMEIIQKLEYLIIRGVKALNGKVVENPDLFVEKMGLDRRRNAKPDLSFIPVDEHAFIYDMDNCGFETIFAFSDHLMQFNDVESVEFLRTVYARCIKPRDADCRKALIFVLGNIDEAYEMHSDLNPDLGADDFYRHTSQISINNIKLALSKRFRAEQIARLGNTHILYPSLNTKAFEQIIEKELKRHAAIIRERYNIKLTFGKGFRQMLYSEGVFPTQGARPLINTIQHQVGSRMNTIIIESYKCQVQPDSANIEYQDEYLEIMYFANRKKLGTVRFPIELSLEGLRKPKKDDFQAITAVHESGHAVISGVLQGVVPEKVISRSSMPEMAGLTYIKIPWKYIAKREITQRLAMQLGGYAAERLIFGDDRLTCGSESDIFQATQFITAMLKASGMGELPAHFAVKSSLTNGCIFDSEDLINEQAMKYIAEALDLATRILNEQIHLLLMMADALSDKSSLDKNELTEMFLHYAVGISENHYVHDDTDRFYRKALKQKVKKLIQPETGAVQNWRNLTLNKEKR